MTSSKISPLVFLGSALCFLFPFVTISCQGQKVASFTGIQLAMGTTTQQPQLFGRPQRKQVDPEPGASVAGLCVIVGLGLSCFALLDFRTQAGSAIAGGVGAVALLFMRAGMDDQIAKRAQGMALVSYELAFNLALLLLASAAALNGYAAWQRRSVSPVVLSSPPNAQPGCESPG
jgi:hypothetical protein